MKIVKQLPRPENLKWILDPDALISVDVMIVGPNCPSLDNANPNNPTGTYLSGQELSDFIAALDRKTQGHPPVLVLDEAYREYVDQPAHCKRIATRGSYFNGHLIGRTTNAA